MVKLSSKTSIVTILATSIVLIAIISKSWNSAKKPSQDAPPFAWQDGAYSVEYRVANKFDLGAVVSIASDRPTQARLSESTMGMKGTVAIKSVSESQMQLWFDSITFDAIVFDGAVANDLSSIATEMREAIEVQKSAEGAFTGIKYSENCRQICLRVWSSLLASIQVTRPLDDSSESWSIGEKTVDASLLYDYEQGRMELRKTLQSVLEFKPLKDIEGRLTKLAQGTYLYYQNQNKITGLKGDSELKFTHHENLVYSRNESILISTLKSMSNFPQSSERKQTMAWLPGALDRLSEQVATEDAWRRELGATKIEDLKAALQTDMNRDEELNLYKKIRAFLYFHPERSHDFANELIMDEYNGPYNRLLAVALGRVGHPQAQKVLMEVIDERRRQDKEALNFLPLLAQTERPTAVTVDYLERLSQEQSPYQNTAILALGQVLGAYMTQDPQASQAKLNSLLDEAERSSSSKREVYFDAIGNSAQVSSFPRFKKLLDQESDINLLASGIKALRRFNDPIVTVYLKSQIHHAHPKIQAASWESLAQHSFAADLVNPAKTLLKGPGQETVQLAALSWIWEHRQAVDGSQELFEQARQNAELSDQLRQQAQNYRDLQSGGHP